MVRRSREIIGRVIVFSNGREIQRYYNYREIHHNGREIQRDYGKSRNIGSES